MNTNFDRFIQAGGTSDDAEAWLNSQPNDILLKIKDDLTHPFCLNAADILKRREKEYAKLITARKDAAGKSLGKLHQRMVPRMAPRMAPRMTPVSGRDFKPNAACPNEIDVQPLPSFPRRLKKHLDFISKCLREDVCDVFNIRIVELVKNTAVKRTIKFDKAIVHRNGSDYDFKVDNKIVLRIRIRGNETHVFGLVGKKFEELFHFEGERFFPHGTFQDLFVIMTEEELCMEDLREALCRMGMRERDVMGMSDGAVVAELEKALNNYSE